MQDRFAPTLGAVTVAIAVASASTMIGSKAYAETPTIETTPFVSTLTREQVRAELMAARSNLMYGEWELQANNAHPLASGYTRAQVIAEYMRSRKESNALTSEDSGSSYLAQRVFDQRRDPMVAATR